MGHTAWAPEGREGRYQAGPKGRSLEVGARRSPRLLVNNKNIRIFVCITNLYSSHPGLVAEGCEDFSCRNEKLFPYFVLPLVSSSVKWDQMQPYNLCFCNTSSDCSEQFEILSSFSLHYKGLVVQGASFVSGCSGTHVAAPGAEVHHSCQSRIQRSKTRQDIFREELVMVSLRDIFLIQQSTEWSRLMLKNPEQK